MVETFITMQTSYNFEIVASKLAAASDDCTPAAADHVVKRCVPEELLAIGL